MNIIRYFTTSLVLTLLVSGTLGGTSATAQELDPCEKNLVTRRHEQQKEIRDLVSEIVRESKNAGSVESARTPEVAELLAAAEEQLRESCSRAQGFPRELNKKGIAALRSLAMYGSARQLQTLQTLILEIHPRSGRYIFGRKTFGVAMNAIQSIINRLHPFQKGVLTAAQLRDLDYWVKEANARGYLDFPPVANLDPTFAEELWPRLDHPMARFRLLELFPGVLRRGKPETEKYLLALSEIRASLKTLREKKQNYDAGKYYFSDLKALAYIKSRGHSNAGSYSYWFRKLTKDLSKPETSTQRAAESIRRAFSGHQNPMRARLVTPPRPYGENANLETLYEATAVFQPELPDEVLQEVSAVFYDFGGFPAFESAGPEEGFSSDVKAYDTDRTYARPRPIEVKFVMRDGESVRVGARFPKPTPYVPNPEFQSFSETSEKLLNELVEKGTVPLQARILSATAEPVRTTFELSLHDLPEDAMYGILEVNYQFPMGSSFSEDEEAEFMPEFDNSFATSIRSMLSPEAMHSQILNVQITLESGKILNVPARIMGTYRGARPERPPSDDVDEDDSDKNFP